MLTARIEAGGARPHHCLECLEPFNALDLLAAIRERQGRVDEAVAVLRDREATSVNGRDALAELLARHDRVSRGRRATSRGAAGGAR
ncbi:hypothetical protein GCM10009827_054840 [Dactylosporangium maewongense]|uniref:Uncharacterized protein n=1 Tax=Dactylosporangium maewongense TaxID=634393 RepID=A0ABP4LUY3_9ACTN